MSNGGVAALFYGKNPALHLAFVGPSDRKINRSAIRRHIANHNSLVFLVEPQSFGVHLFCEAVLSVAVFCYYQKSRCVHVQPVYEANLIAFAFTLHFFHQSVCNGMAGLSLGWVNNHAGLLVDNENIIVLVDYRNRNILRREVAFFFGKQDADNVSLGRGNPPLYIMTV